MGCVKVLTNSYSVPLKAGTQVQAKSYASTVELWHEGRCVARHERCYGRQQQILDLEHYLDVLARKPGALAGSRPLEQQRQAGLWPECFDEIWQALGVRCWFAPHDVQGGKKLHEQIDEAIQVHDRLLLLLSEASMNSEWVKTEMA